MMSRWDKVWLTVLFLIMMSTLVFVGFISKEDNSKFEIDCSFNDIEYKNVSPYRCWNPEIVSEFCPMPKDISCNSNIEGIGELLIKGLIMMD